MHRASQISTHLIAVTTSPRASLTVACLSEDPNTGEAAQGAASRAVTSTLPTGDPLAAAATVPTKSWNSLLLFTKSK